MNYQSYEPSAELESFVKCYWTLQSSDENKLEKQVIIPDGCFEMIFHKGDLYVHYVDEHNHILQPRCFVIGQLTRTLEIAPTGKTDIFAVRFHPEGFLPFTDFPIKKLENTAVPLDEVFGNEGKSIEREILNAATNNERIEQIENFLLKRLTDAAHIDSIVKATVETILTANGQMTIEAISNNTNINRRQLERKFATSIGLSPKQLSKTIRLQATLKSLLQNETTSLTDIAYKGEYYDQAHFIKDFKEFTGLTPKEFYGDKLKMTSFFIGD